MHPKADWGEEMEFKAELLNPTTLKASSSSRWRPYLNVVLTFDDNLRVLSDFISLDFISCNKLQI